MISRLSSLAGKTYAAKLLPRAIIMRTVESALLTFVYLMLYPVLDGVFKKTISLDTTLTITAGIAICYALRMVLFHISANMIYESIFTLAGALRLRLTNHLRHLPLGSMGKDYLARVKSALTDDLQIIAQLAGSLLGFFVSALTLPLFITIGLAFINPKLALSLCFSTLCAIPLLWAVNRFVAKHGSEHFACMSKASARLVEYVLGIKVLKSYGLTGARFGQLEQALHRTKKEIIHLETGAIILLLAAIVVVELGTPLLLLYGTYSILGGTLDAATLIFSLILAVRYYAPVREALALSTEFQYMSAALDRIAAIFDTPLQPETENPKTPENNQIVFHDVSFSYENDAPPALKKATLTIPEGSMTALVGPSGAGKTTVTNLIARFWDVTDGKITLGGVDIRDMRNEDLMAHISIVFQDVILFHDTIMENIRMGNPAATDEQVFDAARRARCHEFVLRLPEGYDSMAGEDGCRLSGGEKQRISIARALLKDAPIILLDEATASVDPSAEKDIQEAFAALARNKTVVVIAHKLSTIADAGQIIVFDGGRIVETGLHADLLAKNGLYKTLWDNQTAAARWQAAA